MTQKGSDGKIDAQAWIPGIKAGVMQLGQGVSGVGGEENVKL